MSKDIRTLAEKAAKALSDLDKACQEVNPDFEFDDRHDGSMALDEAVDTLGTNEFLEQFVERNYTVKVWIAVQHEVTVKAINADAAIEKVEDNQNAFAYKEVDVFHASPLSENVLHDHPYQMVVDE